MPYKLLLADDSLTIQKVVELVLAPENFEIRAFNDGEQALQALESFVPDIVLADIEMPKLNGYQLCEKVKNNMATATIPVILLAGAFEPFDEEYAKSVFADDFIIKPFESQELISKVKALLKSFEPAKKTETEEVYEEEPVSAGVPEVSAELSESVSTPAQEQPVSGGWDEEIPVEEKIEDQQMLDEEYEAKIAFSSEGLASAVESEASVEIKGFEEELAEAMKEEVSGELPQKEIPEESKEQLEEKVSFVIGSEMLPHISSAIKSSIEQAVSTVAPGVIENVTRELMKDLIESLRGEIDAAIKRIVPEVAEALIKKEIEKITSEIN
ncbi:MAG: response regulator [Nitrospirae bacterium]|nr:response regulator [Nitrospirota bacterium]MDA8215160.1 response regulator [Nitrospiraceae bacterium]